MLDVIQNRQLDAAIVKVISSKTDAYGLQRATQNGIATAVVPSARYRGDWQNMSQRVSEEILPSQPDLVCLAGYMCKYIIHDKLRNRVMNIHPALLPAFGGQGMYGMRVHQAVAAAGVKVTGCTVHFCDQEYDQGPIILQRTCPVIDTDTPEQIQQRVFHEECLAYPEAIRLFSENRLRISDGRVHIATK